MSEQEREPLDPEHFERVESEVLEGEVIDEAEAEQAYQDEDAQGFEMPSDEEIEEVLSICVSAALGSIGALLAYKLGDDMNLTEEENIKLTKVWTAVAKTSPNRLFRWLSNSPIGMATVMTLGVFGVKFARRAEQVKDEIQEQA